MAFNSLSVESASKSGHKKNCANLKDKKSMKLFSCQEVLQYSRRIN